MNWIKINFCALSECTQQHLHLGDKLVCDKSTLPSRPYEYLVSDGKKVGTAHYGLSFGNNQPAHIIRNENIKYWCSLDEIGLPDGLE
jgi:hypothetical protein